MAVQTARNKMYNIIDEGSFCELFSTLHTINYLDFPGYDEKINSAKEISGEQESVIAGTGTILGIGCMVIAFEPKFIMGSMGLAAGEKIWRAFRYATKRKLPVISLVASGGARMQEGVFSLMQMAKTAGAVYEHGKKRLLSVSVIGDPTLGGVTASFVSLADIIIGEEGAQFGLTGRRIIEETTREKLPVNFQTVECAQVQGMVDIVAEKNEIKPLLGALLALH